MKKLPLHIRQWVDPSLLEVYQNRDLNQLQEHLQGSAEERLHLEGFLMMRCDLPMQQEEKEWNVRVLKMVVEQAFPPQPEDWIGWAVSSLKKAWDFPGSEAVKQGEKEAYRLAVTAWELDELSALGTLSQEQLWGVVKEGVNRGEKELVLGLLHCHCSLLKILPYSERFNRSDNDPELLQSICQLIGERTYLDLFLREERFFKREKEKEAHSLRLMEELSRHILKGVSPHGIVYFLGKLDQLVPWEPLKGFSRGEMGKFWSTLQARENSGLTVQDWIDLKRLIAGDRSPPPSNFWQIVSSLTEEKGKEKKQSLPSLEKIWSVQHLPGSGRALPWSALFALFLEREGEEERVCVADHLTQVVQKVSQAKEELFDGINKSLMNRLEELLGGGEEREGWEEALKHFPFFLSPHDLLSSLLHGEHQVKEDALLKMITQQGKKMAWGEVFAASPSLCEKLSQTLGERRWQRFLLGPKGSDPRESPLYALWLKPKNLQKIKGAIGGDWVEQFLLKRTSMGEYIGSNLFFEVFSRRGEEGTEEKRAFLDVAGRGGQELLMSGMLQLDFSLESKEIIEVLEEGMNQEFSEACRQIQQAESVYSDEWVSLLHGLRSIEGEGEGLASLENLSFEQKALAELFLTGGCAVELVEEHVMKQVEEGKLASAPPSQGNFPDDLDFLNHWREECAGDPFTSRVFAHALGLLEQLEGWGGGEELFKQFSERLKELGEDERGVGAFHTAVFSFVVDLALQCEVKDETQAGFFSRETLDVGEFASHNELIGSLRNMCGHIGGRKGYVGMPNGESDPGGLEAFCDDLGGKLLHINHALLELWIKLKQEKEKDWGELHMELTLLAEAGQYCATRWEGELSRCYEKMCLSSKQGSLKRTLEERVVLALQRFRRRIGEGLALRVAEQMEGNIHAYNRVLHTLKNVGYIQLPGSYDDPTFTLGDAAGILDEAGTLSEGDILEAFLSDYTLEKMVGWIEKEFVEGEQASGDPLFQWVKASVPLRWKKEEFDLILEQLQRLPSDGEKKQYLFEQGINWQPASPEACVAEARRKEACKHLPAHWDTKEKLYAFLKEELDSSDRLGRATLLRKHRIATSGGERSQCQEAVEEARKRAFSLSDEGKDWDTEEGRFGQARAIVAQARKEGVGKEEIEKRLKGSGVTYVPSVDKDPEQAVEESRAQTWLEAVGVGINGRILPVHVIRLLKEMGVVEQPLLELLLGEERLKSKGRN